MRRETYVSTYITIRKHYGIEQSSSICGFHGRYPRSRHCATMIWSNAPVSGGHANELHLGAVPFPQAAGYFHTNSCWGNADPIANPQNSFQVLKPKFPTKFLNWRNKAFSALRPYWDGKSCAGSHTGCVSEVRINSHFVNLAICLSVDLSWRLT
jgi:hypothetical protein